MWNISDNNVEVCERIIETGLHADMLNSLSWDTLSAESLADPQSNSKRRLVVAHQNTLYNVVRSVEPARGDFRKCKAVDVVHKFRDVAKYPVIFFVLCMCHAQWRHQNFGENGLLGFGGLRCPFSMKKKIEQVFVSK